MFLISIILFVRINVKVTNYDAKISPINYFHYLISFIISISYKLFLKVSLKSFIVF